MEKPHLSVSWKIERQRCICKLAGEIDVLTIAKLGREFRKFIQQPELPRELLWDVKDVTFIDSAAISSLVVFSRTFSHVTGGMAKLLHPQPFLIRVLVITGLDMAFEIEP
jgi:anti-anti-sigma factor